MIYNRFLSLVLFTFLIPVVSYSQFDLIKDFDESTQSSFGFSDGGPLYSIGTKMLVQYDSVVAGEHKNFAGLAAVDAAGNSQRLAYGSLFPVLDGVPFFDFKTLPNGKVAFINIESGISYKVIITDGTTAGTLTVYTTPSPIKGLGLIDNGLYFTHQDNLGHSLMKIDLTTLVDSEVATFGTLHAISDISKISDTKLIFLASDPVDDDKLKVYVSDGTANGTTALAVINSGAAVSDKALLTQVGNKVYFFSKLPDVACCSALWVTNGTVAGTQKLKELKMLDAEHLIKQKMIFGWNDAFYFAGAENVLGTEPTLWVSDGTVSGTVALMPTTTVENIHPRFFTVFKNELYFITVNGTHYENKLYKTDGTATGTVRIDLKHNSDVVAPYTLAADADYLYMGGGNVNASFIAELFQYDGIYSQCGMLEGETTAGESRPQNLFLHEGKLYFTAYLSNTGTELYTTRGDFTPGIATSTKSSLTALSVVYPNPAKDVVAVKSSEKITSLRLINQLGSVVAETTEATIDVSSYAAGIYYVEILFATNESIYQKLLLSK